MTAAVAPFVSMQTLDETEWRIVCRHRHNVILEGPPAETDGALRLLQPHIGEPVQRRAPNAPLVFPTGQTGTLILEDVGTLGPGDQARLLDWVGGAGVHTRIVSTTEGSLFSLVSCGLFDTALYYRLNVMLLRVGSSPSLGM